jgi:hypothetical protein
MATNPAVPCASEDCFVRYFVEVPKLARAPLGFGLRTKCDCVEGSAKRKFTSAPQ